MSPAIMIAAIKSGSGKTTITCGLLESMIRRGMKVSAFKCGPDYIDPMYHRRVIEIDSYNLDTFFSDENQVRELFCRGSKRSDISVVEGVMGLYDGLGGIREEGSSYHLAKILNLPIILVIDAHGMGRTMIPVLSGMLAYDTDRLIKGIIINQTSKAYASTIGSVIEDELGIPVVGFVPKMNDMKIDSRHLGLKMPEEIADLKKQLSMLSDKLEETISLDKIIQIAKSRDCDNTNYVDIDQSIQKETVNIAIALDEAFNFYYSENLRLLEELGANLIYFSPIHDSELPKNIDGIIIGGGYPELKADELSKNSSMKESIRLAIEQGMPSIAECGGFMYLHDSLVTEDGHEYSMIGAIKGKSSYIGKLVRFGYVEISEKKSVFLGENQSIKAHEFHYFDSDNNGTGAKAVKPVTGKEWDCVHIESNKWWGYPHLYYPSNPGFVEHFIEECITFKKSIDIR